MFGITIYRQHLESESQDSLTRIVASLKERRFAYHTKGMKMFKGLDGNGLLLMMFGTVKTIRIKRNPITGRPLITNIWTQILGNRVLTINGEWKQDGVKNPVNVELVNFAPSRNPTTGEYVKDLTPDIKNHYEVGLPDDELAIKEFAYLLTYFTACFSTGQLPTPSKPSGQSTIMGKIVQTWRESAGLNPVWIEVIGKTGVVKRMDANIINAIQSVFVANYDSIVVDWDTGDSRKDKSTNRIEWI